MVWTDPGSLSAASVARTHGGGNTLAAGFARVPPLLFGVYSLAGTLVYAAAVASIGYGLGSAWGRIAHGFSVAGYVFAAVVVVAVTAFVVTRLRELRREARAAARDGD